MEEVKNLNHDVAGSFSDQKQSHEVACSFSELKQNHEVAWVTVLEYWKLNGQQPSIPTIHRRIKERLLSARKALKVSGQLGSGWEIRIDNPKQIEAIKEMRRLRAIWQGRLREERKRKRAERSKRKKEIQIDLNLPIQLYTSLENLKIHGLAGLQFSSFIKCQSEEKKQVLSRHRKWHVKVDEVAHNEIKRLAKENGIPLHDVCLSFLQHYNNVLSQTGQQNK